MRMREENEDEKREDKYIWGLDKRREQGWEERMRNEKTKLWWEDRMRRMNEYDRKW